MDSIIIEILDLDTKLAKARVIKALGDAFLSVGINASSNDLLIIMDDYDSGQSITKNVKEYQGLGDLNLGILGGLTPVAIEALEKLITTALGKNEKSK